uniref:Uncharacterized protein n=1 Tax=Arundo donax TaxID=35708 RepID=A0A0A9EJ69_ARUDO
MYLSFVICILKSCIQFLHTSFNIIHPFRFFIYN